MWGGSPTKRHSRLSRTVKGDGDGHWRRDAVLGDNPRELLQDGQCLRRFAETRVVALGCSVPPYNRNSGTTGGRMCRFMAERCVRKGLRDCQNSCRASVILTAELNFVRFRTHARISQCHLPDTRLREPGRACGREVWWKTGPS